jgi:hypothetical protein
MASTTEYTGKPDAATTLRDFVIQGAAELGECGGAQSFRATRRNDGTPVLLHKFRPAAPLTALGLVLTAPEPPDFGRPFLTCFTDFFTAAGSAYLVEPLPVCSGLADVWRHILQKRPRQTVSVMTVLLQQMLTITRQLALRGTRHGALDARNVVLAPTGSFGLLTARLEYKGGSLWLRRDPERAVWSDTRSLVDLLDTLLDLDAEMAVLQKTPMRVPLHIHRRIRSLLRALERTYCRASARRAPS